MDAREKYKELLALSIEYLTGLGFKKRGKELFIEKDFFSSLLHFQKTPYSHEGEVVATLNIGILPHTELMKKYWKYTNPKHFYECPIETRPELINGKSLEWVHVINDDESASNFFEREFKPYLMIGIDWIDSFKNIDDMINYLSIPRVLMLGDRRFTLRNLAILLKEVDPQRFNRLVEEVQADPDPDFRTCLKWEPSIVGDDFKVDYNFIQNGSEMKK